MIKTLRAVAAAMLLATGITAAQAATVEPSVIGPAGGFKAGEYNTITFRTGTVAPPPWTVSTPNEYTRATMTIGSDPYMLSIRSGIVLTDTPFTFSWLAPSVLPDTLLINVTLRHFRNAYLTAETMTTQDESVGTLLFYNGAWEGNSSLAMSRVFVVESPTGVVLSQRAADTGTTVVPIAGTLPLMLSALGLGALVMRRRAKAALA